MRGAVASGHPLTARAAADMFSLGGNAFDAAVAAGFASVAAEPTLTSLGGGGFLLAHIAEQKEDILFDFFVNTPGLGSRTHGKPAMTPVDIHFPECTQVFHTGFPSAAVPGMLKGLLHVHKRLCTLPLKTVLAPALSCLREGVEVTALQEYFLNLLEPIFGSTDYGREIYTTGGESIKQGGRLFNPLLERFFEGIAEGRSDIYNGETARSFTEEMEKQGCLITPYDLEAYEVIERKPLRLAYRDSEILTNPPPSSGGMMLALGLSLIENLRLSSVSRESAEFFIALVELMKQMQNFKPVENTGGSSYPLDRAELSPVIESFIRNVTEKTFIATQGTTHISAVDGQGNAASMTTSNG
ncbi:MAG: gamma-glutamyltransferase, partial [Deferribacteres bacterium]|nr:gamma-glutamyltransferase [Deferribacteres bacterium]